MSNEKKYDAIVFIGRFQPFHNAHLEIFKRAMQLANEVVIVIGSSNQPRTYKNPFTTTERRRMIQNALLEAGYSRIINQGNFTIQEVNDSIYDDNLWASRVQKIVQEVVGYNSDKRIAIIGHDKDESSFYLKMFPQWDKVDVELIEPLNATDVRDLYFRDDFNENFLRHVVPGEVMSFMNTFKYSKEYQQIIRERKFIETYRKQFEHLAYPPIFVTTDAVVFCQANVLLVKRKAEPGKGLWALPGGHLNANSDSSVQAGMLRELKEETKIKVPDAVLIGNIKDSHVFDAKNRSARGRTITHAFNIVLSDTTLPKVKGSDDAEEARWVPLGNIRSDIMFEDHYDIIQYFM